MMEGFREGKSVGWRARMGNRGWATGAWAAERGAWAGGLPFLARFRPQTSVQLQVDHDSRTDPEPPPPVRCPRYRVLVFSMAGCSRDSLIFASEDRRLYDWPTLALRGEAVPLAASQAGQPGRDEPFGSLGRPLSASSSGSNSSSALQGSRAPAQGQSGWLTPSRGAGAASNPESSAGKGSPMGWQALKSSALARRSFQDFLASSPSGIDGGTVNKWLSSHVGGIDAFGYSTFKDLMRAAETAGLCRLGGTKSLYVYPPPPSRLAPESNAVDSVQELQRLLTLVDVEGEAPRQRPRPQPQPQRHTSPPQQPQQQPQQLQHPGLARSGSGQILGRSPGGPGEPHIPAWLIAKIRSEFWNGRREEVTQPYTRLVQWLNREVGRPARPEPRLRSQHALGP